MGLFGKKKPAEVPEAPMPAAPAEGVPTERIIQLRQQGLSNTQITETLQREGFSSAQVYDAMSQADIKGIVETPAEGVPAGAPMPPGADMPPLAPAEMPPPIPRTPPVPGELTRETVEEIAESIIDEKWEELIKSVDKIVEWKESAEKKMIKMEHEIKALKANFEELHKGVLGKISEYDKGIRNVGTDIKAMGEVFKKVIPTLTESVGQLSRITKKIKKKK